MAATVVTSEVHSGTETPAVELIGVTKAFAHFVAVDDLHLAIGENRFFALLGPSGCGKTTTLRMVGGFEDQTSGVIKLHGEDVTGLRPYRRPVNTVFQSYALFPHLTIFENVAFGLRRQKVDSGEVNRRVNDMLELVQLTGMTRRKPRQLSGGQQQRVALARALINHPRVLLLDEPLGALDLKLRKEMQIELKRIQSEVGITFLHVTHDQEEAMTMADTIAVMNSGRIERLGSPTDIYEDPRSTFVAGFLGASNLLEGVALDGAGTARLPDGTVVHLPAGAVSAGEGSVRFGVRPEKVRLYEPSDPALPGNSVVGTVKDASFIGVSTQFLVTTSFGVDLVAVEQNIAPNRFRPGDRVAVGWDPEHSFVVHGD
jgi:spermidine/putrescine transport system ATP-binding protein